MKSENVKFFLVNMVKLYLKSLYSLILTTSPLQLDAFKFVKFDSVEKV